MSLNALRMCVVLQDCADQLSVIGNIMRPAADTVSNIYRFIQMNRFILFPLIHKATQFMQLQCCLM